MRKRLRHAWHWLRRWPDFEWPDLGPGEDPFEEALVRLGPPRKPLQSGAVALPLPEPEEWDVDAYGRAADL